LCSNLTRDKKQQTHTRNFFLYLETVTHPSPIRHMMTIDRQSFITQFFSQFRFWAFCACISWCYWSSIFVLYHMTSITGFRFLLLSFYISTINILRQSFVIWIWISFDFNFILFHFHFVWLSSVAVALFSFKIILDKKKYFSCEWW
jgi:hypothetical protein